jgi:hypothetical protein
MKPRKVKSKERKISTRDFLRHGSVKRICPKNWNPHKAASAACNVRVRAA